MENVINLQLYVLSKIDVDPCDSMAQGA